MPPSASTGYEPNSVTVSSSQFNILRHAKIDLYSAVNVIPWAESITHLLEQTSNQSLLSQEWEEVSTEVYNQFSDEQNRIHPLTSPADNTIRPNVTVRRPASSSGTSNAPSSSGTSSESTTSTVTSSSSSNPSEVSGSSAHESEDLTASKTESLSVSASPSTPDDSRIPGVAEEKLTRSSDV